MEQLISNHTAAREGGKVVSMQDYMGDRKAGIKEWLYQEVCRVFGADRAEDVMKNPLLRLSMKYDGLNDQEQENMFRYTEKVMAEQRGRRIGRKNIISELLNLGYDRGIHGPASGRGWDWQNAGAEGRNGIECTKQTIQSGFTEKGRTGQNMTCSEPY